MKYTLVNFGELDKHAIKSYCAVHEVSEELNLGDITKIDETKLHFFNMIVGGSPCQDFSIAGKRKGAMWICNDCKTEYNPLEVHYSKRKYCPKCNSRNLDKTRSSLLVEFLRIVQGNKPDFGVYENVKNIVGKQFKETTFKLFIEELQEYGYNVYWKVLNAKNFGIPQNRERVFVVFIKKEKDNGLFQFPQPFDNGIRLKHMLEDAVNPKYYVAREKTEKLIAKVKNIDSLLLDQSNMYRDNGTRGLGEYIDYSPCLLARDNKDPKLVMENKVYQVGNILEGRSWDNPQTGKIFSTEGCAPTLNACGGGNNEPKILIESIGNMNPSSKGMNGQVFKVNGLAPTLTTNKGEGNKIVLATITPDRVDKRQNGRRFKTNGEPAFTVTTQDQHGVLLANGIKINKYSVGVMLKANTKKGYALAREGDSINLEYINSKTRRGRIGHGVAQTLTRSCNQATIVTGPNLISNVEELDDLLLYYVVIRKLTSRECWRLMGFSDTDFIAAMAGSRKNAINLLKSWNYTNGVRVMDKAEKMQKVSNSQLYKQAGNSIVIDVLYYLLKELYNAMPYLFQDIQLVSLFSGIGAFEAALNRLQEEVNKKKC